MALLAAAGLFLGLALLAAIPLVLLLHLTQRNQDDKSIAQPTADQGPPTRRTTPA